MYTKEQQLGHCISVELEMVPYINIHMRKTELEEILHIIRMLDAKLHLFEQDDIEYEDLYDFLREYRDKMTAGPCVVSLEQGYILPFWLILWGYQQHYGDEPWIKELSRKILDVVDRIGESQHMS